MILIKHGKICHESDELQLKDILIQGDRIIGIEDKLEPDDGNIVIIDAGGKLVTPAFIDPHVHLREPGFEYKEDFLTGTSAALIGGFSAVCCMPNTSPTPDTPETLSNIMDAAKRKGRIPCYFFGSLSMGLQGEELVDFKGLLAQGVLGFSDDGKGLQHSGMMDKAMQIVAELDSIITAHCEEDPLLYNGYIHRGTYAATHGHRGISSTSESVQVSRDVLLALDRKARYHVCHISTRESVDMIAYGKRRGARVSCEVTPHHLLLCDEDLKEDGMYKMNPPLRSRDDMMMLRKSLAEGIIDCVATDHAPHSDEEKSKGLEKSAFGIIGLEIAFPLLYTHLCKTGELTLTRLIDAMTSAPAKIFRLPVGELKVGGLASINLIDLEQEWEINRESLKSKSSNTPFMGQKVYGFIDTVIIDGTIRLQGGDFVE